eukprot:197333_1
MGYIRIEAKNEVKCPLDVVRLLINYMFIDYKKPRLSLCVAGHVDSGKSTLCGRLLYDLNIIPERVLNKHQQYARELGKESFQFAHLIENVREEQCRGISILYHVKHFYSQFYHYTLIDVPGHRNYINNMMNGASQCDIAILMVPADTNNFKASIARGNYKKGIYTGNTRQHAYILHYLGIKQLIVCINKMDSKSVHYSQDKFNEIKDKISKMLVKIGYKIKKIAFIPISAFNGDNVVNQSVHMDWYKGFTVKIKKTIMHGYTLLDALDGIVTVPKRAVNKPFLFPVSRMYRIKGVGIVCVGNIVQGEIKQSDMVKIYPRKVSAKVSSLQIHFKSVEKGVAGDDIGIALSGISSYQDWPRRGDVICLEKKSAKHRNSRKQYVENSDIQHVVKSFVAHVFVHRHPGRLSAAKWRKVGREIIGFKSVYVKDRWSKKNTKFQHRVPVFGNVMGYRGGYTPSVHVMCHRSPAAMIKILWKKKKGTNEKIENPEWIEQGDEAEVEFSPVKQLVVKPFDECKRFGRIIVMDHCNVIMIGKVLSVSY